MAAEANVHKMAILAINAMFLPSIGCLTNFYLFITISVFSIMNKNQST